MKREDLCCHEARVLEFTKYPTSIKLFLKGVHIGFQVANAELLFKGIKTLEVDDKPAELPIMAACYGEVLTLDMNGNKTELLIEWNDFVNHIPFVRFYLIECDEIAVKISDLHFDPGW